MNPQHIIVIGAGVGGLTTAALLAQAGHRVTVLEAQTYPGGCASTFYHQGYSFDSGATTAGGFQANGPHHLISQQLGIDWDIHPHDPAWVVHLPDRSIALTHDNGDVLRKFPQTARFWDEQRRIADICWSLSAQGLPFPPSDWTELAQLAKIGLSNFPRDLRIVPYALGTVKQWLRLRGLANDAAFARFIDAQLLISAQNTARYVNAVYGATALDLARQGVYHIRGGIGGIAEKLVSKIRQLGGNVLFRQHVTRIAVEHGRASGVFVRHGKHTQQEIFMPCDFLLANVTPWSLDQLLREDSPKSLQRELRQRVNGSGAFVLHVGVQADLLPPDLPDHHQIITSMAGALGEGRSIFMSISPTWDTSRAPVGYRAVTISTHTEVNQWWTLLAHDKDAYYDSKLAYSERILNNIEQVVVGFRRSVKLTLPGTPVTYNFYTGRHLGMVGGFAQTSLFAARGPRTGLPNVRLVGDSIFPGQSTAGVTLGAIRVTNDIQRYMRQGHDVQQNVLMEAQ
ncbi:MAG: NAD(P)/FAD-dependent oxidoreductase [Anaerolineae bacterium]